MRYRSVGKSSLQVSEIAFGTGDTAGGLVYGSSAEQRSLVEAALDLGMNVFDCSPDYGKGMGEANLGRVLKDIGHTDAIVITKVEIWPEHLSRIGERVAESINDSLLRLRRDSVDIIMLHNPIRRQRDTSIRQWMRLAPEDVLDEVLPALVRARDAGKVGLLGLACESSETSAVAPLLNTGEFAMINAWFNLSNPTAGVDVPGFAEQEDYRGLFAAAERNGVGVAVIRPLAGGALTDGFVDRGAEARHGLSRGIYREQPHLFEPEIERARRFNFLRQGGQETLSLAAWRYVLGSPAVSTVIGGFSDHAHMREAALASDLGPLDGDAAAAVLQAQQPTGLSS